MGLFNIFTECYSGPAPTYPKARRPSATPLLSKSSMTDMEVASESEHGESRELRRRMSSRFGLLKSRTKCEVTLEYGDNLDQVREKLREVSFDEVIHQGFRGAVGEPRPATVQFTLTPALVR
ncbi:hypothetical protein K493DRAFT_335372 [Basidiobolus meristosporus CBS 931.73]|uniref:Uncharacterized protein n=1 Tax=Basidiobolus meristosporus CBS 931.73 TaxID=1314790 RepID=A0A1Y1YQW7_9FUNG|nr:hypothetical protein K493DRAFT_335372 [Basidiobolus meristosporus CBS 931.73]|eukprot:ORY00422.1 hypothetical protein K493DRAFT_335372 [Basidiobolus meristosporus CBS 931.73]